MMPALNFYKTYLKFLACPDFYQYVEMPIARQIYIIKYVDLFLILIFQYFLILIKIFIYFLKLKILKFYLILNI